MSRPSRRGASLAKDDLDMVISRTKALIRNQIKERSREVDEVVDENWRKVSAAPVLNMNIASQSRAYAIDTSPSGRNDFILDLAVCVHRRCIWTFSYERFHALIMTLDCDLATTISERTTIGQRGMILERTVNSICFMYNQPLFHVDLRFVDREDAVAMATIYDLVNISAVNVLDVYQEKMAKIDHRSFAESIYFVVHCTMPAVDAYAAALAYARKTKYNISPKKNMAISYTQISRAILGDILSSPTKYESFYNLRIL